jgi:hypothetical protein
VANAQEHGGGIEHRADISPLAVLGLALVTAQSGGLSDATVVAGTGTMTHGRTPRRFLSFSIVAVGQGEVARRGGPLSVLRPRRLP